jgi:hypothetical protein
MLPFHHCNALSPRTLLENHHLRSLRGAPLVQELTTISSVIEYSIYKGKQSWTASAATDLTAALFQLLQQRLTEEELALVQQTAGLAAVLMR